MRRSGRRANTPLGISLFPFLAVLLCTMGSLIVLLICLVERAGVSTPAPIEAAVEAAVASPEELQALENAADDAAFVSEQLKSKKEEYAKALAAMRDEMGIAERLLREQEDKTKLLQSQLVAISEGNANSDALEVAKEQAEKLRKQIAELEKSRLEQEESQRNKPKRMSIIPYQGKNGTTQRPIYVECMHDRVVIQPEGIEFLAVDFLAAKSAGNPLDASLRAVREHYAKKSKETGDQAPYPLFIVRPGGDIAFLQARMAIVSWEDEFGYELIDDTVELAYSPPEPQLAEILRRAASDARKRQEALARALPGRFRGADGNGGGSSSNGSSAGAPPGGGTAIGGVGEGTSGSAIASSRFVSSGNGRPKNAGAEPSVGGPDSRYLDGVAPKTAEERARFSMNERAKEEADKAKQGGGKSEGQKFDGKPIRHGAKQYGDKDGVPGGKGGAAPTPEEIKNRGKNWANKAADSPETAVARAISVRCSGREIVFLPPKGSLGKPIAIEWDGDPVIVVDSIALQVRNRIKSWGMAIGGGYWDPVLDVEVAPDGEQRFADLVAFFDQSGIKVQRKKR